MTNDDEMVIRELARSICADQSDDSDSSNDFIDGKLDRSVWMALVEKGIHAGIKLGRSM